MRKITGMCCHQCAPKEWRHTQNMTGSYEMDASIAHCSNKDAQAKLQDHLACGGGSGVYSHRTNYSGYGGLSGDD